MNCSQSTSHLSEFERHSAPEGCIEPPYSAWLADKVTFPSKFIFAKSLVSELMFSRAGSAKENSRAEEEVFVAGEEVF